MTLFWNKVREFGALLARHGFLVDGEDVFYLRHDEVRSALEELRLFWSSGGAGLAARSAATGRRSSSGGSRSTRRCAEWSPPPRSARCPTTITEPITVMLWGITQRARPGMALADSDGGDELSGIAGSPGWPKAQRA